MLTDTKAPSMRVALQQIYVNLYVEYGMLNPGVQKVGCDRLFPWSVILILLSPLVVKNPLSPVEHPGGVGVNNELFEESLQQFVVRDH
jgi:trafficking protein particle complex subunit 1